MILHIVPDDKFIDMAYNMFEIACPNNNEFLVVTNNKNLKYIKTTPVTKVSHIKFFSHGFKKKLSQYEFIIIHWLDDKNMKLLLEADKNIKFLWIGWGGDYYNLIKSKKDNLLLPKTKELVGTINLNKSLNYKEIIKSILKKVLFFNLDRHKAIQRVDCFAPVLYEDYALMKNSIKDFKPQYIDWNYGTLEDDFIVRLKDIKINANNILLGNSDTATNNHLEVFDMLNTLDIKDSKIIAPLSYGNIAYRDKIIKVGKYIYGKQFIPLINFMSKEEYNKIISSCSNVIMNHTRQQALGNIIIMMYVGAKIFLRKENPVYSFFKNNNAIIFSIEELNNENFKRILAEAEIKQNREILISYWSRKVILQKTKKLIETMREIRN